MRYTDSDRVTQLDALTRALDELVTHLPSVPNYAGSTDTFRRYADAVRALVADGYTQSELNNISRSFPAIIHTHPHWDPPLIETRNGGHVVPTWFSELERLHTACADAAKVLSVIGTY